MKRIILERATGMRVSYFRAKRELSSRDLSQGYFWERVAYYSNRVLPEASLRSSVFSSHGTLYILLHYLSM